MSVCVFVTSACIKGASGPGKDGDGRCFLFVSLLACLFVFPERPLTWDLQTRRDGYLH